MYRGAKKIGFIDEIDGRYRIHPDNETSQRRNAEISKMVKGYVVASDLLLSHGLMVEAEKIQTIKKVVYAHCNEHLRKLPDLGAVLKLLLIAAEHGSIEATALLNTNEKKITLEAKF